MKILLVGNGSLSVAHQELAIAAGLKRAGHEVQVIHDPDSGFFNKGVIPEPLVESDIIRQQHGNYKEANIRYEPDVIFGLDQSVSPFVVGITQHIKKPSFCMFLDFPKHVIDEGSAPDYNPEYSQRYYYWLSCTESMTNVIFNNNVAVEELSKRSKKQAELVWYPLCNLDLIDKINSESEDPNGRYSDPYVASCHRFIYYKGTEYLIKALYGLGVNYKAISVSGNIEQQVIAFGKQILGDIFFYIGKTSEEEKLKIIKNAMLLCYPQITPWVGGLSPLEAMALKVPVVCFDYPVLRELYSDCAVYAKRKDIDDLQEKLLEVLNESDETRIERANRASERIQQYFTTDVMANNLTKVFEKYL
jgi:glycosyltransferase involved in cell wall biosynthesis